MGYRCCLWSNLQIQGILTLEGAAFPLQPCTARDSGHFAYTGSKVWERIWKCVSQGTKPCPARDLCSWGCCTTAMTAAFLIPPHTIHNATKAQKWLKLRNTSHQYSTFLRTGDRQITDRSSALSPFTFPSPICKIYCYEWRNYRDLSLPEKAYMNSRVNSQSNQNYFSEQLLATG